MFQVPPRSPDFLDELQFPFRKEKGKGERKRGRQLQYQTDKKPSH